MAEFDGGHFVFGNGDMYINDGQKINSLCLPHKMRDHVFNNISGDDYQKAFVVADYGNTEMWACYVSQSNIQQMLNVIRLWFGTGLTGHFTERDLPNLGFIALRYLKVTH